MFHHFTDPVVSTHPIVIISSNPYLVLGNVVHQFLFRPVLLQFLFYLLVNDPLLLHQLLQLLLFLLKT